MRFQAQTAIAFAVAIAVGCSSPSENPPVPDAAPADAPKGASDGKSDRATLSDTKVDTRPPRDTAVGKDEAPDELPTADAFVPGPVEPLVVNSGNTGTYDLVPGTWKVFSFDTVAGHLYCVSGFDNGAVGYLGGSSSVSPTEYSDKTDSQGRLFFSEYSSGKRYVAAAANTENASGSFQVADGGELLIVGENTVDLTASAQNDYRTFCFIVAPGHDYTVSITGDAKKPIGLGLSPRAERTTDGKMAVPFSETSGPLPITDQLIPFESTVESYTRYYFLFLRVEEAVSLNITITLAT